MDPELERKVREQLNAESLKAAKVLSETIQALVKRVNELTVLNQGFQRYVQTTEPRIVALEAVAERAKAMMGVK